VRPNARVAGQRRLPLADRLELLRVRGEIHRLELALARQELHASTRALRQGASVVRTLLRALTPGGATGALPTVLRIARWLLPLAGSVLLDTRAARTVRRLRAALAAGTLGVVIVRIARRMIGKRFH